VVSSQFSALRTDRSIPCHPATQRLRTQHTHFSPLNPPAIGQPHPIASNAAHLPVRHSTAAASRDAPEPDKP
jgi:hypothetical protein